MLFEMFKTIQQGADEIQRRELLPLTSLTVAGGIASRTPSWIMQQKPMLQLQGCNSALKERLLNTFQGHHPHS